MAIRFDGQRLAELRRKQGRRTEDLARDVGRGFYALKEYEYGRKQPPLSIAVALADALGVSVEELLIRETATAA